MISLLTGSVGLLLKKSKFFIWIGSSNKRSGLLDDDEPSPVSESHVLPEVPLADIDQLPLVSLQAPDPSSDTLEHFSLNHSKPFQHKFISLFLKLGKGS